MTNSLDDWLDRRSLLTGGLTKKQVDERCRSGDLHRIRPGRYVAGASWAALEPDERHRLRAHELATTLAGRAAISHESAALLHGFELPATKLARIHITWSGSSGRRATTNVHPHRGKLDDDDLAMVGGVLVTAAARTVFDVARSSSAAIAISAADSALRMGTCSTHSLAVVLARTEHVPGHHRAVRIIEFADSRAESVGESICRLRMAQLGVPDPDLQVVIPGVGHRLAARVDFEIPEHRTVVEFDGRIKYGRLLKPGQSGGDVAFDEKRREDAIRETGREVVRIVWDELDPCRFGPILLPRFRAAFHRSGTPAWSPRPARFSGV